MLWSIKKEKWFFGPKMPQEYNINSVNMGCSNYEISKMCLTNVNSTTAFLLNMPSVAPMYSYNYLTNTWSKEYQQLLKDYGEFFSCVLYLGKNYQRYLLQLEYNEVIQNQFFYRFLESENHISLLFLSHKIFFLTAEKSMHWHMTGTIRTKLMVCMFIMLI